MRGQSGGFSIFFVLILVMGGLGVLLWMNAAPAAPIVPVIPTEVIPTEDTNAWQDILRAGFGSDSTPLPTVAVPQQAYVAPTLPPSGGTPTPIDAADIGGIEVTGPVAVVVTPTQPPPTATSLAPDVTVTGVSVTKAPVDWQPPPLSPPLSRDPLGRDHYWFIRPLDSNANNAGIFYYTYGSDGPQKDNPLTVHHGIDMPNPIGEPVRAAGPGIVIHASDNLRTNDGIFENSPSYGNVVVIEHDFGYEGQRVWTLYAHLSAALVVRDQQVKTGDVIGLVGNTGRVSGPHVHFEVRMGENLYRRTYNPLLWMVPYVGTGVIAGRVMDSHGNLINDADITVRNWATGLQVDTTTSYVFPGTGFDVNTDPKWGENFVVADVPIGKHEVIVNIDGQRVVALVDVQEGTTNFVELKPEERPTAQPVATEQPATPET